jgi:nitrite reductase/ring-hydroxylating ferredoxin subunit
MTVRKTLCRVDDIADRGAIAVELDADERGVAASVLLLRVAERVYAYRNECPHAGRRLDWAPGRFLLEDDLVICAAHGACFAVASGRCIDGPARGDALTPVAIEIVDREVRLA